MGAVALAGHKHVGRISIHKNLFSVEIKCPPVLEEMLKDKNTSQRWDYCFVSGADPTYSAILGDQGGGLLISR